MDFGVCWAAKKAAALVSPTGVEVRPLAMTGPFGDRIGALEGVFNRAGVCGREFIVYWRGRPDAFSETLIGSRPASESRNLCPRDGRQEPRQTMS